MPDGYAYAITQSNNCWCSNYTPAKSVQVSTSKCSLGCPGFPDEKCGGDGLFGYVSLTGAKPSGTKGGDSATSTDVSFPAVFHYPACMLAFPFRSGSLLLSFFHLAILQCSISSFFPSPSTPCMILSITPMTNGHFHKPLSIFPASLSFIR